MTRAAIALAGALLLGAGVVRAVSPSQLPPSVRASAPKGAAPLTEEERKAECTDLTQLLTSLRKDPTWVKQPLADREVRQLQRALDALGCPDEAGGFSGTWRIEGPPSSGNRTPLNGTMVLKRIQSEVGAKAALEQWGSFSMRNEPCPGQEYYRGTIDWDHGSFFHTEYCCWWKVNNSIPGSPPSQGEILLCGSDYELRGRFKDGQNGRGGGITIRGLSVTSGEAFPDFGRTINVTLKRGAAK
jgi:hypothetical protein